MIQAPRPGSLRSFAGWMVLAIGVAVVILRSWSYFALPPLEYEDGAKIYAYFYENRGLGELFRFKSGYLPLPQNLMGFLSVRIAATWAPYFLTWLPLLFAALVYARVAREPGRLFLRDRRLRCLLPLLFLIAPLGQIHLLAHTDYTINNCALLVGALTCLWPLRLSIGSWLLTNALVWTHPLTLLSVPFLCFDAWRHPGRGRWWRVATAVNCIVYGWIGVHPETPLSLDRLVEGAWNTPRFLAHTTTWITLGPDLTTTLVTSGSWVIYGWTVAVLALPVIAVGRGALRSAPAIRIGLLILGWAFFTLASRGVEHTLDTLQIRYWYVPGLFLILLMVGSISSLIGRRWGPALGAVLLLGYGGMNLGNLHWYHERHPDNGASVRQMMLRIEAHERQTGTWRGLRVRAAKELDWPIEIDTR